MRQALFIARKDIQYTLRERASLVWIFLMPVVFFYFIGTITGGSSMGTPAKTTLALKIPTDAGFLASQLQRRLEENDFNVIVFDDSEALPGEDGEVRSFGDYRRRLSVPNGFSDSLLAGESAKLLLDAQLSGLAADYDELRINRAVYTLLADVVAAVRSSSGLSEASIHQLNETDRALTLNVQPAGARRKIPTGFEQTIPGTMVMFTMLVSLTSGAILLFIDRQQGRLRRLAATPIPRSRIVLGKWGGKVALALVQILVAFLLGTFLFRMDWGPDLPMIFLVLACWGGFCASTALLLGSLGRTEGQVAGLGVFTTMALAALGGCWWPIEIAPPWMQSLAHVLPSGIAMDAMHNLISFRTGAAGAIPHVLILAGGAALVGWLAHRAFRFE